MINKVTYSKNLILDEGIKKPEKIFKRIRSGKSLFTFYVVCFVDGDSHIQIINSHMFITSFYEEKDVIILAIFKSKDSCFEYVKAITDLSFNEFDEFKPLEIIEIVSKEDITAKLKEE